MLALDWRILNRDRALTTMREVGIEEIDNLSIAQLLEGLRLGSPSGVQESFPKDQIDKSRSVNISNCVSDLKLRNVVADVNGSLKFYHGSRIYFPTLVSPTPRTYLARYIEVAKQLREKHEGFTFVVWLEDRLSVINNKWDAKNIHEGIRIFQNHFAKEDPECSLLVSSEISAGIPSDFADRYLSKVTGADLISILPYHLRHPHNTRILDVAHFAWMCYLAQRCPGIHFAGASSKRHYQIFRSKVTGKSITALLFKLGSEKPIGTTDDVPR